MLISINGKESDVTLNVFREDVIAAIYALRCRKGCIQPGDGKLTFLVCFESQRAHYPLEVEHFTFLWKISEDAKDALISSKEIIEEHKLLSICMENSSCIFHYGEENIVIDDCSKELFKMLEKKIG